MTNLEYILSTIEISGDALANLMCEYNILMTSSVQKITQSLNT